MIQLTLCMIVRDEEEMLPGCLESVRGVVDRLVVVDTGSRDGTPEVARRHGALLVEHVWNDDFSDARNAGLAHIDEGFVLVLDADERLAESGARALRVALEEPDFELGLLPLHDAAALEASADDVVSGRARRGEPQWLPRLLRRTRDLHYEGIVHESVLTWASSGRPTQWIDAPIVHYGAVPAYRCARGKGDRNRRLLERRCELEPDHPTAWAYLAAELERSGEGPQALEAARCGWQRWRAGAAHGSSHDPVLPATLLSQLALRFGDADEAGQVAAEGLDAVEHPNLHLLAGVAEEQSVGLRGAAALARAGNHYQRCLELRDIAFASEVMPGATSWQAATRLGTVRLQEGRPDLARGAFARALGERPEHREALLGFVEAVLDCDEVDRALGMIAPLLVHPDPDVWLLAARGAQKVGSVGDAQLMLARAREANEVQPFCAPHRSRALRALEAELGGAGRELAAVQRKRRVFAWPRYDVPDDLDLLFGHYGKLLWDRPGLVLCLRHDAALDGDIGAAEANIERAFAGSASEATTLEVILLDGAERPDDLAAAGDVAIELPHASGPRRTFLEALATPRIASREALERALAS